MKNMELLVSMFEKEIGVLKDEIDNVYENHGVHSLIFIHKSKITLKILLFETEPNKWVIHHELSRENPFLLKKIIRICDRMQRIMGDKDISFSLSEYLIEIQKQNLIITTLYSVLQNFLTKHFTLFEKHKDKEYRVNETIDPTKKRYANMD